MAGLAELGNTYLRASGQLSQLEQIEQGSRGAGERGGGGAEVTEEIQYSNNLYSPQFPFGKEAKHRRVNFKSGTPLIFAMHRIWGFYWSLAASIWLNLH
ncbi:hypothetical protein OSCI_3400031 [Kamptonema sp. PCC 6506]|nr:hypothetical protein OSCI_3400031 [Kamptonema sp. PCC 6506]